MVTGRSLTTALILLREAAPWVNPPVPDQDRTMAASPLVPQPVPMCSFNPVSSFAARARINSSVVLSEPPARNRWSQLIVRVANTEPVGLTFFRLTR